VKQRRQLLCGGAQLQQLHSSVTSPATMYQCTVDSVTGRVKYWMVCLFLG
jgi:hypothetical protein